MPGGAAVARYAHNVEIAGSIPAPATINTRKNGLDAIPHLWRWAIWLRSKPRRERSGKMWYGQFFV